MPSISLSVYAIRVLDVADKIPQELNSFDDRGSDLFTVVQEYLAAASDEPINNEGTQKVAKMHEHQIDGRIITGVIRSGEYGYTSDIVDIDTGDINYEKAIDEASLVPFFFCMWLPENRDEGILILQNFKQLGINAAIREILERPFNRDFSRNRLSINALVPESAVMNFLNSGRIMKARFIEYRLPIDQAEAIGHDHEEQHINVEYSLTAKSNTEIPIKNRLLECIAGTRERADLLELEHFNYDDVKVEVEVNGKAKTINLFDFKKIRPRFDISENVDIAPSGHPYVDSVQEQALLLLREIATAIGTVDDL